MTLGWDPIDELDGKEPTPAWETALFVVLSAFAIIILLVCR